MFVLFSLPCKRCATMRYLKVWSARILVGWKNIWTVLLKLTNKSCKCLGNHNYILMKVENHTYSIIDNHKWQRRLTIYSYFSGSVKNQSYLSNPFQESTSWSKQHQYKLQVDSVEHNPVPMMLIRTILHHIPMDYQHRPIQLTR